jgi:hypothetical protein
MGGLSGRIEVRREGATAQEGRIKPFRAGFPALNNQDATGGVKMTGWGIDAPDRVKFRANVDAAIEADRKGRKFEPLYEISFAIMLATMANDSMGGIPGEDWHRLCDYLTGKHRGKAGYKSDRNQQDSDDRFVLSTYIDLVNRGTLGPEAVITIAAKHKIDQSNVYRAINRAMDALKKQICEVEAKIKELGLEEKYAETQRQRAKKIEQRLKPFIKNSSTE